MLALSYNDKLIYNYVRSDRVRNSSLCNNHINNYFPQKPSKDDKTDR